MKSSDNVRNWLSKSQLTDPSSPSQLPRRVMAIQRTHQAHHVKGKDVLPLRVISTFHFFIADVRLLQG